MPQASPDMAPDEAIGSVEGFDDLEDDGSGLDDAFDMGGLDDDLGLGGDDGMPDLGGDDDLGLGDDMPGLGGDDGMPDLGGDDDLGLGDLGGLGDDDGMPDLGGDEDLGLGDDDGLGDLGDLGGDDDQADLGGLGLDDLDEEPGAPEAAAMPMDDLGFGEEAAEPPRDWDTESGEGDDLFGEDEEDDFFEADEMEGLDTAPGRAQRGRGRGLLWVLIVILFLIAVGAGVWFFAPELFAPLGLGPEMAEEIPDDPTGKSGISIPKESAQFSYIQNEKADQLLVLTGLVKNSFQTSRSFIRLKGLLTDEKKQVLASKLFFAGNVLTEDELKTLPMDEIDRRLSVRGGQKGVNMNIGPGQSIRFMVVFDKIPKTLREYTVEAFSSEPGSAKK